jgi:6-pyruvoyltetrahydropterin/6-carboxytetrahydropterin synthase
VKLTRRYRFAASHRLDVPSLSREENRRLFGKCNNPYGHGHDYIVDVTVEGQPDESGQIVNRLSLDDLVHERILEAVDHKNLNCDVTELRGVVPTTENLAKALQCMLLRDWPLPARLSGVRISETDRNTFELRT